MILMTQTVTGERVFATIKAVSVYKPQDTAPLQHLT